MSTKKILLATVFTAVMMPLFTKAQSFNYEIKGEIKGLKNDTLIFNVAHGSNNATIKVVAVNDKFDYKGTASGHDLIFAEVADKRNNGDFTFFVDKGILNVTGDVNNVDDVQVSGTPINDEYSAQSKKEFSFYKQRDSLYKLAKDLNKDGYEYKRLMTNVDSTMEVLQTFRVSYIKQHPASMFSGMSLYLIQDQISAEQLELLYASLLSPAKDLSLLKNIPDRIRSKKASETGKVAPDFTIKDMNGKTINLSAYKGRYVLLDFWASWCVPCRQESAGLVKAYQKFKGSKFEIISVSSDVKEANWRKAIADDKLNEWIHVCDFKGLNNVIANEYGVQPIPDNFLIDPNGKIIARNIFGEQLEQKLTELLGGK